MEREAPLQEVVEDPLQAVKETPKEEEPNERRGGGEENQDEDEEENQQSSLKCPPAGRKQRL